MSVSDISSRAECHACVHATSASDRLGVCRVHVHVSFLRKEPFYIGKYSCAFICTPMFGLQAKFALLSLFLFLSLSLPFSFSFSLSLSRSCALARALFLAHSNTHTLSKTLSHVLSSHFLSLFLSFAFCLLLFLSVVFPQNIHSFSSSALPSWKFRVQAILVGNLATWACTWACLCAGWVAARGCCQVCIVLQCVVVFFSVLQCVAVCCSVVQCVAVWCSVLQCVAV